ncbi:sugar phosphate isomerase/epimerase family protein [Flectobacillus sp. DC10W]|uniref:Sugar phosphate isomerase/epimerase family protein n=1 Tax=Flectobacillus longus TaxID=2984207 RepID=A0ABT6YM09_9BACT|nr:sugar phosphate isomerase/epimerase family protein [Flectobacillus longus]MDI9864496.1 sugar phosphate isomerase/epimerase family protein [Flectobacillus longus]
MLDLGIVSAILADNTFEQAIDFVAANGFKCIEIMCWPAGNADARRYAGVTHIDVESLTPEKIAYIKQYVAAKGIYISGLGYYPNPLDANETQAKFFQDHIKKIILAAAQLGVPVVNTFIGRDISKSVAYNLDKYKEVWPEIVKLAEDNGVKIGIENCPMFFTDDEWPGGKNLATTPAIWDKMFTIIPSATLGLNYDPSHLLWQQMDYCRPIYDYTERLHHIHLKDAKVYKEKLDRVGIMANPLEYHSPKLPGFGDINWGKFISALNDVRYRGPIVIEVEDKAYESSSADIEKAILTARNYLKQFLPY